MADETLVMLAKEVRAKTLRLLEGVNTADALWTPAGLQNHVLWHAGHAYVVVERLTWLDAGKYPEGWFETFSWKSQPAAVTAWPALPEVVSELRGQLERVVAYVRTLDEGALERNVGSAEKPRTLRYSILHAFHDEAGHQGEIHLLKKMIARR